MVKAIEIMNANVITVTGDDDIYEAVRTMVLNNITGMPVLNENETLAGIITEKDVLKLFYVTEDPPEKIEDYMTPDVVSFDTEASLSDIAHCFMTSHFRRVPILDSGKLVGIISRRDIIRHISNLRHESELLEKDSILEILY